MAQFKRASLLQRFNKAARKAAVTAGIFFTSLLAARAQSDDPRRTLPDTLPVPFALAPNEIKDPVARPARDSTPFRTGLRPPNSRLLPRLPQTQLPYDTTGRQAYNDSIVNAARQDMPRLMTKMRNDFTAHQDSIEVAVNVRGGRLGTKVKVVDAAQAADLPRALYSSGSWGLRQYLKLNGITIGVTDLRNLDEMMAIEYVTDYGVPTYTQNPHVNFAPSLNATLLVPASDHALPSQMMIEGLNHLENFRIINTHESFHATDSYYAEERKKITPESLNIRFPDGIAFAESVPHQTLRSLIQRAEAFADISALAEILRTDTTADISMIDKMIRFRALTGGSTHSSQMVLQGLKDFIGRYGVEYLRSLSDATVKQLCYELTDLHGMSPSDFRLITLYAYGDAETRADYERRAAEGEKQYKKIIDMYYAPQIYGAQASAPEQKDIVQRAIERNALMQALREYEPSEELVMTAHDHFGKVTPETIIGAYTMLYNDLRGQLVATGGGDLAAQKMIMLRNAFILTLGKADYFALDKQYPPKVPMGPFLKH